MDKFSELSKPVDFLKSATLITARNFERWSKLAALTSEASSVLHTITLLETSQLLTALLAELEAKDKRIDELEAKLATPVRLPEKFSMLHRTDFHEDYHSTMAFKSDEVFGAIRAAGFTVGDE